MNPQQALIAKSGMAEQIWEKEKALKELAAAKAEIDMLKGELQNANHRADSWVEWAPEEAPLYYCSDCGVCLYERCDECDFIKTLGCGCEPEEPCECE